MAGTSINHNRIARNVSNLLENDFIKKDSPCESLSEIRLAVSRSSFRILIGLKRDLGPITQRATGQKYPFIGTDMPAESGSNSPELVAKPFW